MKSPAQNRLFSRDSGTFSIRPGHFAGFLKLTCLFSLAATLLFLPESGGETLSDSPRVQPYFHVEAPSVYDMGVVDNLGADWWDAENKLDLLIAANFHHDGIKLEISDLEHVEADAKIGKERIYVRQLHKDMYKPMNDPVTVTDPMTPGVVNLSLDFRVRPSFAFAPGNYNGILTVTFIGP